MDNASLSLIAAMFLAILLLIARASKNKAPGTSEPSTPLIPVEVEGVMYRSADSPCIRPYSPIGTLSDGNSRILQLFARPSSTHRDRWHYFTSIDDNQIPVELQFHGRRCQSGSIGCEEVRTGDEMSASEFTTSPPLRVQLYGE